MLLRESLSNPVVIAEDQRCVLRSAQVGSPIPRVQQVHRHGASICIGFRPRLSPYRPSSGAAWRSGCGCNIFGT